MIENKNYSIYCKVYSNSRAWGHVAYLFDKKRGIIVAEKKVRYHNRTWERYQFETVMACLIDKLDSEKNVPLSDRIELYKQIT